jgi:hypothetical protein
MASFISPERRRFDENQPVYFLLGGAQSRNALEDFKGLPKKEIKVISVFHCYKKYNSSSQMTPLSNFHRYSFLNAMI